MNNKNMNKNETITMHTSDMQGIHHNLIFNTIFPLIWVYLWFAFYLIRSKEEKKLGQDQIGR